MLKLPPTVRTAYIDEVPKEYTEGIKKAETANIVEGYTFFKNSSDDKRFNFYSEINIDNLKLWDFFCKCLLSFDGPVSLIFGLIDEEPFYGRYTDKNEVLNTIEKYRLELTQDPFLEFGIIYSDENTLKEIYIPKPKYIKFWGFDMEDFFRITAEFSLSKKENLNFVDEYPMVSLSLKTLNETVTDTNEIIKDLYTAFCEAD